MGKVRARAGSKRLYIDYRHQGIRCREQALLDDSPANRKNSISYWLEWKLICCWVALITPGISLTPNELSNSAVSINVK